jgi:hypothetical protein
VQVDLNSCLSYLTFLSQLGHEGPSIFAEPCLPAAHPEHVLETDGQHFTQSEPQLTATARATYIINQSSHSKIDQISIAINKRLATDAVTINEHNTALMDL